MTPALPRTGRIGIVTALQLEAGPIGRHPGFAVRVCGVAGPGIEAAVGELGELGVDLIVSWGTAGALSPQLRAGDLLLPERVVAADGAVAATDAGPRERVLRHLGTDWHAASGTLLTADRLLATPDEKRRLGLAYGARAVDMESRQIGEACAARNMRFLIVRAIVDELDDRLPRRILADTPGVRRPGALLAGLGLHPGEWPALIRLAYRYRRARAGLAVAARALARCAAERP